MTEVEKKAREVMRKTCGIDDYHELSTPGCKTCAHMDRAIEALSAAGLLVTDLHERALVACKQMAESGVFINSKGNEEAFRVGREALAAEKPQERLKVSGRDGLHAVAWSVVTTGIYPVHVASFTNEPDAIAYAAMKNAEGK